MGAGSTKHATSANERKFPSYTRSRSSRSSLRLTKDSAKEMFSPTYKYLQSLNDDFEKGVICHKKLADLRRIEGEVNEILRDLQNYAMIDNSSSKRFELENTAKYLRNKLKSTIDTHMDSAIRKLNIAPADNSLTDSKATDTMPNIHQENDVQVITENDQVSKKLRETAIKLRELFCLVSSMYIIDQITENSTLKVLNKCKGDLYHIQPKTDKHLIKRSKCFRAIDDIRTILLRRKLGTISTSETNPGEIRKIYINESEDCESDPCGIEGDNEDNDKEADEKGVLPHNKSKVKQDKLLHEGDFKEPAEISSDENMDKLITLKNTLKSIRSFFLSSSEIDESTRKLLEEMLNDSENHLRRFKPVNSTQQKKKTRYLKNIEEMKLTVQKKYCDSSDEGDDSILVVNNGVPKNKIKTENTEIHNTSTLDHKPNNNKKETTAVKSSDIILDDNKEAQNSAFQTTLLLKTEKLYETFNRTLDMIFRISKICSSTLDDDLNIVTENMKDMQQHFIDIMELLSRNEKNTISKCYVLKSQATGQDNRISEIPAKLLDTVHSNIKISTTQSPQGKHSTVATSHFEEIKSKILRGRSSPNLFKVEEKFSCAGKEIKYIRAASSMSEYSSYVDELEPVRKSLAHDQLSTYRDLHRIIDSPKKHLISTRNIDLSLLASDDINFDPLTKTIQNANTISTRNIDLSQLASRESDSSLLENHQENYDQDKVMPPILTNDSSLEAGIFISFLPELSPSAKKDLFHSSSVNGLETHTHGELSIATDLQSLLKHSGDNKFDALVETIQSPSIVYTRKIDFSQLSSRESNNSVLESHEEDEGCNTAPYTMGMAELTANKSLTKDTISIPCSSKDKHVKATSNESKNNLSSLTMEDSNDLLTTSLYVNSTQPMVVRPDNDSTVFQTQVCNQSQVTIETATRKFEILKEKIMNFIGLKTSDVYNELDEELVEVMMLIDCLQFSENDPLKAKRDNIVQGICKYSILLERKHIDHEFLDDFEAEISLVESEMTQSLANQKLDNLKNIASDVADMISEIENKILDHLLVERQQNCIIRLESINDKLSIFLK